MSFTDHKITQFQHKIADLADQPTLPPAELKSRFDACPEELRQSLNAVCDDAARLEARVEGIVVDTFGDTIDKEMLSDELAAELDGKATQSALSAAVEVLEQADGALESQILTKCQACIGSYTGNSEESQMISLGVTPKAVLIASSDGMFRNGDFKYGGIAIQGSPSTYSGQTMIEIVENGFKVYYNNSKYVQVNSGTRRYIALV